MRSYLEVPSACLILFFSFKAVCISHSNTIVADNSVSFSHFCFFFPLFYTCVFSRNNTNLCPSLDVNGQVLRPYEKETRL
jgi:hypothetical protein